MTTKPNWTVTPNIDAAKYIGPVEFQDNKGEWHNFEIMHSPVSKDCPERIVFGGACNVGFLESGYIYRADCESFDETLQELLSDLETYYNDGPQYTTRIVCNECM